MSFIKELYTVEAKITVYKTNDLGERYGTIERVETLAFSYDEAIDIYVGYCEEGHDAEYKQVDQRLVKAFNALDEQFQQLVFENIRSKELSKIDTRYASVYESTKHSLIAVYDSLELFMNATNLKVYSVENRYNVLKKEYEIKEA